MGMDFEIEVSVKVVKAQIVFFNKLSNFSEGFKLQKKPLVDDEHCT